MNKYKVCMLLISLVVLATVLWYFNPYVIGAALARSDYTLILAAFGVSFMAAALGVLKWKVLLGRVKYFELFPVQILGYTLSNFTPGKAGEPAKAVLLKMRSDIAVSTSLASIIWERLMDLLVLICLSIFAVGIISVDSSFFLPSILGVVAFSAIVVISLLVLYSESFGRKIFNIVRKLPLLKRLPENFMDLFYGNRIKRRVIVQAAVITLITWLLLGVVMWFVLSAFSVSPPNILVLSGVVALSVVVGIASSLPGGVGTTEIVMIFLLGLLGIDNSIAPAAAIAFRLATIWFVNAIGGISFIYLSRKFKVGNVLR